MTKFTNRRVVVSGDTVEILVYEKPIAYDFEVEPVEKTITLDKTQSEQDEILKRSLQRTKSTLRRIIQANTFQWLDHEDKPYRPKFVTLTFAENIKTVQEANPLFTNFIKRLNFHVYRVKRNILQYVVVPEFQKRGAVHYHVLFFNLGWIDSNVLESIWKHGFIKIKNIDNIPNIGAYMAKYIGKDLDDKRLSAQKHYFASRKLKRPITIKNPLTCERLTMELAHLEPTYQNSFHSDMNGKVDYVLINLPQNSHEKRKVLELLNS